MTKLKIKGLILDFGFTIFYFKNVSVKRYFECYKKGLQDSANYLEKLNILKDDLTIRKFISLFNKKRAFFFKESIKTKIEFPTNMIFQNVLETMEKKRYIDSLIDINEEIYDELANLYHAFELEEWVPFEHTRNTLKKISKLEEIKIAILSNHPHHATIENLLKKHDLLEFFDTVVTSAKFGKRKPDPDIFYHTLKKMGLENYPNSCLICGDEHADVVFGHRAGLKTILCERLFKFPFEKEIKVPNFIKISNISEILDYII